MRKIQKRKIMVITASVLMVLLIAVVLFAKSKKVSPLSWKLHKPVNSTAGIAVKGYDVVAYQTLGKPVKGTANFKHSWAGSDWQFSSENHLALFKANPEKYAPQFGGYCSFAVSKGFTASVNPEVWHIEDGKLYLFDSDKVKESWLKDISKGIIQQCETKWR